MFLCFPCEAWVKNANFRRIVLNKSRQSQVMNLHNNSSRYITKECIVLTVEMADDPTLLKVRAGNGKIFKLSLMEGVQPAKAIPKDIDVVPGDFIVISCCVHTHLHVCSFVGVSKNNR